MDWLKIGGVAEKVVDRTFSFVESEVTRYRNVEEELERLKRTSERINSLLTDAEERRYIEDESVKRWLCELRSVSFDSDNLFDEYQTALNIHKYNSSHAGSSSSSRKRKHGEIALSSLSLSPEWGPFQRRKFSTAIDKINQRLEDISKGRKSLRLKGEDGPRRQTTRAYFQPTSCHDPAKIVGRDAEAEHIFELLKSDLSNQGKIVVVAIHGAAGLGKTTLAQKVFDVDGYFDKKFWVSLSDGCDPINATEEIFKKIANQNCDFEGLDTILNSIRDHLMQCGENKILLVIDNLWIEYIHFWESLEAALLNSKKDVRVLITTRNNRVDRLMSASSYILTGLNEEDCWELLCSLALPSGIHAQNQRLELIGKEIAKKCGGSPMAAKILGAHLNGRDEEEWCDVLSEMRALKDDKNGVVLPSLKISYHHLPYYVKLCFAYCSIFPNGYTFEKDQVIRYWLAEGLIQPEGRRRLEAIGSKYFDDLLWRSFFEKTPSDKSRVEKYKIPSLMYDLSRLVAQYEFVGLNSEGLRDKVEHDHTRFRYCSLLHQAKGDNRPVKIGTVHPYVNLRTFKICAEYSDIIMPLKIVAPNLFLTLKCLRVLDLSNSLITKLPDSVGDLIHLRYLGLSNTKIETLPEKVSNLFNLQTLELKGCLKLKKLPQGMNKLINLRHLDLRIEWERITNSTELVIPELVIPEGIGELEFLQTLSRFYVPSDTTIGHSNINELKDLNLRGDLCILNLENVQTSSDALDANLRGKEFVENLMLRWSESSSSNRQQWLQWQHSREVLKSLQPNNRIKCLWIVNYPGTVFPGWIGDSSFSSLETIRIASCNNFTFLKLLGKLPRLKNLQIEKVAEKTMVLISGFPSLECLILLNMCFLERLSLENMIPTLEKINVSECPDLQELVIHRDLYPKFERGNCPRLTKVVYVPQD